MAPPPAAPPQQQRFKNPLHGRRSEQRLLLWLLAKAVIREWRAFVVVASAHQDGDVNKGGCNL